MSTEYDSNSETIDRGSVTLLRQLAGQSITYDTLKQLAISLEMPEDDVVSRESVASRLIETNLALMDSASMVPGDTLLEEFDAKRLADRLRSFGLVGQKVETWDDVAAGLMILTKFTQTAAFAIYDETVETYPTLEDYARSMTQDTKS